jgi:hypothetical protein
MRASSGEGDTEEDPPDWRPVMSSRDAESWVAESAYPGVVYHVTTIDAAAAIRQYGFDLRRRAGGRAWGNGVYTAIDLATRDRYLVQLGRYGVALRLRVRVRRLLSAHIRPLARLSPQRQVLAAIPDGVGWFIELGLVLQDREAVFTHVITEAGYDAVEIRESRFTSVVGGNQLVVSDAKSIVVIDDEYC